MKTKKVQIAARLPVVTLDQLDELASDRGLSRSDVIETLIAKEAAPEVRGRCEGGVWTTIDAFDRAVASPDVPRLWSMAAVHVCDTLRIARLACESVFGAAGASDRAAAVEVCRMMLNEHARLSDEEQILADVDEDVDEAGEG
tara:strand:+ start:854 stop:1282 length:429 start_codon:yes stop_codon:yes gene_type:complete